MTGFSRSELPAPSTRTAAPSNPPGQPTGQPSPRRPRRPPGQGRPRIQQDNRQVNRVREGRAVHQDSAALESTRTAAPSNPPGQPLSARSAPPVRAVHVGHQLRGRNPPGQGRPRIQQDNRTGQPSPRQRSAARVVHQDSRALESTRTADRSTESAKAGQSTRSTAPSNPPGQPRRSERPTSPRSPVTSFAVGIHQVSAALESTRTGRPRSFAPGPLGQVLPLEGRTVHQVSRALESTRTRPELRAFPSVKSCCCWKAGQSTRTAAPSNPPGQGRSECTPTPQNAIQLVENGAFRYLPLARPKQTP